MLERYNPMDWFMAIIRIAGASFPGAASLVQFQSEIDAHNLGERVARLEDPISFIHEDVPELAKTIYARLKDSPSSTLAFDAAFYYTYRRPLAALEASGFVKGNHALGARYAAGVTLTDPTFIMYMCALAEDPKKMEALIKIVDECEVHTWLDGDKIGPSLGLPIPVVKAVFTIFANKGYGILSREIGRCQYCGRA